MSGDQVPRQLWHKGGWWVRRDSPPTIGEWRRRIGETQPGLGGWVRVNRDDLLRLCSLCKDHEDAGSVEIVREDLARLIREAKPEDRG